MGRIDALLAGPLRLWHAKATDIINRYGEKPANVSKSALADMLTETRDLLYNLTRVVVKDNGDVVFDDVADELDDLVDGEVDSSESKIYVVTAADVKEAVG
jgi:hypothetical protein